MKSQNLNKSNESIRTVVTNKSIQSLQTRSVSRLSVSTNMPVNKSMCKKQ